MFPAPFEYYRAATADEAIATLSKYGGDARILAGGQSLIPAMRFRLARPAVLVDVNPASELGYLNEANGSLRVGAIARDSALERSPLVASKYALLCDVGAVVADPVVRQMGTVVGSLCHNDPSGDWPVAALAMRAQITVMSKDGKRTVSIDDFIVDSFSTAVADGEMAVEVSFPTPAAGTSGAYKKLERKVGDFATACASAALSLASDGTISAASVAIGAVGPVAMRVREAEKLLTGARPSKELLRAAGDEARKIADPVADTRGSADYKKDMAGVLLERALRTTLERLEVKLA